MDPLPARALYNHKFSRLYNLPREVLLQIMHHLKHDTVGFFMLRCASRLFCHMASLEEFQPEGPPEGSYRFRLWCRYCKAPHDRPCEYLSPDHGRDLGMHTLSLDYLQRRERALIRHLLEKDRLCDRCRAEKLHEKERFTWGSCKFWEDRWEGKRCSGCKQEHSGKLFSPTELNKDDETRVCIGREGYVRVCSHLTLTWAEVERGVLSIRQMMQRKREMNQAITFRCIELARCRHQSHANDGCRWVQRGPIIQPR